MRIKRFLEAEDLNLCRSQAGHLIAQMGSHPAALLWLGFFIFSSILRSVSSILPKRLIIEKCAD